VNARLGVHRGDTSLNLDDAMAWNLQKSRQYRRNRRARPQRSRRGVTGARKPFDDAAVECQRSTARDRRIPTTTRCGLTGIVMKSSLLLFLLAAAGLASSAAAGPIYRCTGPTGATVFSQTPCGKDAATIASNGSTTGSNANDAVNDKAALTEIDARCDAGSHKIVESYRTKFADANASIADLHRQLMVQGEDGVEKDPAVQKKIEALEARKTDLLGSQDRELSTLRNQCQVERTAEMKRQADRDASRAMVKR
jgi:hypothetical protein